MHFLAPSRPIASGIKINLPDPRQRAGAEAGASWGRARGLIRDSGDDHPIGLS
jgi:hypothetical protein